MEINCIFKTGSVFYSKKLTESLYQLTSVLLIHKYDWEHLAGIPVFIYFHSVPIYMIMDIFLYMYKSLLLLGCHPPESS